MDKAAERQHRVTVVGVPLDLNSSFLRGPALAPRRIREVLHSGMGNWFTERGLDLGPYRGWRDAGDLPLDDSPDLMEAIERAIRDPIDAGSRVLVLGGDHSITYPIVRAHAATYPDLTILHIDAHPDLYDDFEGNPSSHASPFARIMESGMARRLVQVGIRTATAHQREQAARFGAEWIEMCDVRCMPPLHLAHPLYLSLDLDALDPAFAPGVSHHEPGGMSVRDVLDLLHGLDVAPIGADIVEYNPTRDAGDVTAAVAAKFFKEILGLLLHHLPSPVPTEVQRTVGE